VRSPRSSPGVVASALLKNRRGGRDPGPARVHQALPGPIRHLLPVHRGRRRRCPAVRGQLRPGQLRMRRQLVVRPGPLDTSRPPGCCGPAGGWCDARLAAKSRTRTSGSWAMHGSARARLARKVRFATINMSRNSRNKLLVTGCERSVQGRYRNSAVNAANYPGLPQERTPSAWSSPSPWSWRSQCRVSG
jgi:hypothetical protein